MPISSIRCGFTRHEMLSKLSNGAPTLRAKLLSFHSGEQYSEGLALGNWELVAPKLILTITYFNQTFAVT